MRYKFEIRARLKGAIGWWSDYTVEVEADTEEEAHRKLYDTYEHIQVIRVVEVKL